MTKVYLAPSAQPDNSYAYGGYNEQQICNRIAEAAKAALIRNGFEVLKAREGLEMEDKVRESNAWGADVHIPIHTDAGGGQGTTCFVYPGYKDNKYAKEIYNAVAAYSPGTDRGIREHDGLYEINETSAMCVYIENEFHDNPTLAEWIVAHTEELGEQYAKGMCAAEGKVYVGPGTAPKPSEPEKPDEPVAFSNMMGQRGPKPERKYSMEYDPSVQQLQTMLKNNIGYEGRTDGIADETLYDYLQNFTVELNDKGALIEWVQNRLNILNFDAGYADGYAEQPTMDGIRRFQEAYGLGVGYLGGTDWYYMIES